MPWTVDGLEFDYRKSITPTRPGAALTDYPLKVGVVADADIGGRCLATGNDLRFTRQSDDALLSAERDFFSVGGGAATGVFWVRVPSLPASADTPLWCYYGNAGASAQASPASAYSSDFSAVYHINEGSGLTLYDSTANDNDSGCWPPELRGACLIGDGIADGYATLAASASLMPPHISLSCWVYPHQISGWPVLIARPYDWNFTRGWYLTMAQNAPGVDVSFGINTAWATGHIADDAWHLVTGAYDGASVNLYIDGALAQSTAYSGAIDYLAPSRQPGIRIYQHSNGSWYGVLSGPSRTDEHRIMSTGVPLAWHAYDYVTQITAAGGLTWGAEEVAVTGGVVLPYSRLLSLGLRG